MRKIILITGASHGIGSTLAKCFAKNGYDLALCCRNSYDRLEELAASLRSSCSADVLCFQGDVADFSFVEEMIRQTLAHFDHIDVLINNAGMSHIGLLSDMSIDEWNRILSVNLTSVFSTCKCVIPSMVARQHGKILNISSVWGETGASCEAAYSACKGGMNALTRALGKELAPSNIQVNAISCGVIDTRMNSCFTPEERNALMDEIPASRFGTPEEVAELALALVTGNDYLNGQIIRLDGGWC
jgi:3-oxoacyl-[acyl-carrier protein] reductase